MKPSEIDWRWIACVRNSNLIECIMEADLSENQIIGLESLPERIRYRKLLFVGVDPLPIGIKINFNKMTCQASPECIGSIQTSAFLCVAMADGQMIEHARKFYGEKVVQFVTENQMPKGKMNLVP